MDNLAPGFRFYPTEEELICFYLRNKLEGTRPDVDRAIPVLDIYEMDPWHLPQYSGELCRGDPEQWFFFTPRQVREARGGRPNRTAGCGYWKATGSPGYVYSSGNNRIIGIKKTMVFYKGKAPNGRKTEWKMNEYRAIILGIGGGGRGGEAAAATLSSSTISVATPNPILRYEYSLCRVYVGSGCLRAFDRRPSGTGAAATTREIKAMQHVNQAASGSGAAGTSGADMATISHQHQNPPTVEKSSSRESSFSCGGDHAHLPPIAESTVWGMTDDEFQSRFDWETLNWDWA